MIFYLILGEEELQLQLALAMSREEAEQEETKSKSDDMRLQLALQKSKEEGGPGEQQGLGYVSDMLRKDQTKIFRSIKLQYDS